MPTELTEEEKKHVASIKANPSLLKMPDRVEKDEQPKFEYNGNVIASLLEDEEFVEKNGKSINQYVDKATKGHKYQEIITVETEEEVPEYGTDSGGTQMPTGNYVTETRRETSTKEKTLKAGFEKKDIDLVNDKIKKARNPEIKPTDVSKLKWAVDLGNDEDVKKVMQKPLDQASRESFNQLQESKPELANEMLKQASTTNVMLLGSKEQIESHVEKTEISHRIPETAIEAAVKKDCDLETLTKIQKEYGAQSFLNLDNAVAKKGAEELPENAPVKEMIAAMEKPQNANQAIEGYLTHMEEKAAKVNFDSPSAKQGFEREIAVDMAALHKDHPEFEKMDFAKEAKKMTTNITKSNWKDDLRDWVADSAVGKKAGVKTSKEVKTVKYTGKLIKSLKNHNSSKPTEHASKPPSGKNMER